ncbi:MAG: serine/threonine-protein kinase [Kofleriaceae bacterium]
MAFDGPRIGERYVLGPRLGHGSQAETFLARDERATEGQPAEVVVKRIIPRGTWKSFELFEREAKVLSQLRHPGVPKFIATFEDPPGTFNLVMQRMPGSTLRELFDRRRVSELELRDVLIRGLEILDYLHTRTPPVIHRDLKPSNIVRAPDGKLALVDFGGVLDGARQQGGSTVVGTFGYMAPEQLHGEVTGATDLYALGATVVALAGGVEPEDVPRKGLSMDLEKHLPSLDPGLRRVLTALTTPDPAQRPQRARDVVKLLAQAAPPSKKREKRAREQRLARRAAALPPARQLFPWAGEPWGTLLRLGVLGFGLSGWAGMAVARYALLILYRVAAVIVLPARGALRQAWSEVDPMLAEGQAGFQDLMRAAVQRRAGAPRLPERAGDDDP